jgi:hypothetical protein
MSLMDQFIAYLKHYSDRDIVEISEMFADDVALRDWKISVLGKEMTIAEIEKNFSSAKTIEIEILHVCI